MQRVFGSGCVMKHNFAFSQIVGSVVPLAFLPCFAAGEPSLLVSFFKFNSGTSVKIEQQVFPHAVALETESHIGWLQWIATKVKSRSIRGSLSHAATTKVKKSLVVVVFHCHCAMYV